MLPKGNVSRHRSAVRVEVAAAADLAALRAIDVLLVARERQEAILAASVANGGCLVARDGAAILGYLTWDEGFLGRPFVRLLVVAAAHRRGGVGRALVAAAEREIAPYGEIFVSTEQINVPMQTLLGSMTYVPSGTIDNINEPGNLELVYYKRLLRSAMPPDERSTNGPVV